MRKLLIAVLPCFMLISQSLEAQYYYYNDKFYESAVVFEVGISGGIMNALTDLGGKKGIGKKFIKDLRWQTCRPSSGAYILANYKNALCGRIEGTIGTITGYDSILKAVASTTTGRYERNLSFKSKISEVQLAIEVHPLFFKNYGDEDPPKISPYIVLGAGYYSFDPQAKLGGEWFSLQPLHTEGEGFAEYPDHKSYSLNQFNIVGGLGLRYELNNTFNVRLEFLHRKLFTDYLDDVSSTYIDPNVFYDHLPPNLAAIAQQLANRKGELNPNDFTSVGDQRGDPSDKDAYFTIVMKVGMSFGRRRIK
jgi:hypothetical protein